MTERDAVLGAIRSALAGAAPSRDGIPRSYRRRGEWDVEELLDRLEERLREYKAIVHRVSTEGIGAAAADVCRSSAVETLVVPQDLERAWIPTGPGILRDPGVTADQLDRSDAVLTGCALAIAETGTIVLDGGPGQGRRALSLIPDHHICVVRADQIVGIVPEGIERLGAEMRSDPRPLTFISGPSATSDIEFRRVEGVHGPRRLEVLLAS